MIKKLLTAIAVLLVVSVFAGTQVISLVGANPMPYPSVPNTELPTLTIQAPEASLPDYANNTLKLNFTITKPDSWNLYHMGIPAVGDCTFVIYLDGTFNKANYTTTRAVFEDWVVLTNLTSSQHALKFVVMARTFSSIGVYLSNVTQTAYFTIDSVSQTIQFSEDSPQIIRGPYPSPTPGPSPNPTITPTISPTATPLPTPDPTVPEFSSIIVLALLGTVSFVVIVECVKRRLRGNGGR